MKVVGCFLEYDGRFVLLHRLPHKPHGNTWGLPSGKVKASESDFGAIQRELYEETGYKIKDGEAELLGAWDFVSPQGEIITYVTYRIKLDNLHEVTIEEAAHSEYKWVSVEEADAMDNLTHGNRDLFRLVGFIK